MSRHCPPMAALRHRPQPPGSKPKSPKVIMLRGAKRTSGDEWRRRESNPRYQESVDDSRASSDRTCPEFAPIWARDTRRRLFVNLEQLKLSVMFSVTAPGADLYPFDPRFCSHSPSERCSGAIGCRVTPDLAAAFNRQAGSWWS